MVAQSPSGVKQKRNSKFPLTRRSDGRWQKKFRGKTYYFSGSKTEALAEWERLRESLTPSTPGHVTFLEGVRSIPVSEVTPSPENDEIYDPIDRDDPNFQSLVADIGRNGIRDPLRVTSDPEHYIVSGHRRYAAAVANGLTEVPCLVDPIRRLDDIDAFARLLISHNEQRVKSVAHKLREEAAKTDPQAAYLRIKTERAQRAMIRVAAMDLGETKVRSKINRRLRKEMLDVLLPLFGDPPKIALSTTDRSLHYLLGVMEKPPLLNVNRPDERYTLSDECYKKLCSLLTQARMEGLIPWEAIEDETRPVTTWNVHRDPASFIREHLDEFLSGYYRDLLQSQPHYIEALVEKNTIAPRCRNICGNYCMPVTSGRGFCSARPRYDLAQRYRKSGKDKLILLIVSDLDPAGMYIAETFARSMRDDFGVEKVHAIKVAVTPEQVQEFNLPKGPKVKVGREDKKDDSRAAEFMRRHGKHIYEVEALPNGKLEELLDDAIRSVLDLELYNAEVAQEEQDAAHIESAREAARWALRGLGG